MKISRYFVFGLAMTTPLLPFAAQAAGTLEERPNFLPFLRSPIDGQLRERPPTLDVTIGSTTTSADMDTGSTGVVVSLMSIPNWKTTPSIDDKVKGILTPNSSGGKPVDESKLDKIEYSSSGKIIYGLYLKRSVTISGRTGVDGIAHAVTTDPINVLAVVYVDCVAHARNCHKTLYPTGIAMLGVGFGRETDHQPHATPDENPFLHVKTPAPAKGTEAGYMVTVNGVKVGLDAGDIPPNNLSIVKLQRNRAFSIKEWLPAQAYISLAGRKEVLGGLLVDTGINTMFMTVPSATSNGFRVSSAGSDTDSQLKGGVPVSIRVASTVLRPAGYGFITGESGGIIPDVITLVGNDGTKPDSKATFVNTGVHFLNGYDYDYDYDNGWLGFYKRCIAP
jgi:hypothetical protein